MFFICAKIDVMGAPLFTFGKNLQLQMHVHMLFFIAEIAVVAAASGSWTSKERSDGNRALLKEIVDTVLCLESGSRCLVGADTTATQNSKVHWSQYRPVAPPAVVKQVINRCKLVVQKAVTSDQV